MWSYIKNPDVWIPLLAVLISIVALWQTNRQIKLSNKQQLFDRRLGNYLIIEGLISLYQKNRYNSNGNGEQNKYPFFTIDVTFNALTNNSYLEDVYAAIIPPFDNPVRKIFLTKLEELHRIETECELIFSEDISAHLCGFVSKYRDLLNAI